MRLNSFIVVALLGCCPLALAAAADDPAWTQAVERAAHDYHRQLVAATAELAAMRLRVATERLPFEETQRDWQNQILASEARLVRLEVEQSQADTHARQLQAEVDGLNRNLAFVATLGKDALGGLADTLRPGEAATVVDPLALLQQRAENPENREDATLAVAAAALILPRLREMIGGQVASGSSLKAGDNELVPGTFLWIGPDAYFRADRDGSVGTVRQPEGVAATVAHPLNSADRTSLAGLFRGELSLLPLDASGGKALQLQEVRGTWSGHIAKGGPIGYIILVLGALAVVTALLKIIDLRGLAVDPPERIQETLTAIAAWPSSSAGEARIATLYPTTRELFQTGWKHLDQTKEALEESLYAAVLRLRMRFERRLAFLTVIVAAAPLLGLLGTVTGMVKTFTLINVFGTGNAAKLSSGISEALVTTELGLIVAIPTLVLHGYLSRKTQRNLSLLERYAAEFVAMATVRHARRGSADAPSR